MTMVILTPQNTSLPRIQARTQTLRNSQVTCSCDTHNLRLSIASSFAQNSPHHLEKAEMQASVQFRSLSCVQLFVTPWTAARQAFLSITNSRSLLKLMSIESVIPSNHLILCRPLLILPSIFPPSGSFQMSQLFTSGGQSIGVSAST